MKSLFEKIIQVRMITVKRAQNRIKTFANGSIIGDQIIILGEGIGEISEGGLQLVGIVCIFGGVRREKITIQAGSFVIADGDGIMFDRTGGAAIRAAAAQEGQSVQAFILRVLEEYIGAHDLHQGDGDAGGR